MQNKTILLAGGTGFIGTALANHFGKDNHIIILTRKMPHTQNNAYHATLNPGVQKQVEWVQWDAATIGPWQACINRSDVVINLAGKSVNCRYTARNKQAIFDSRTAATAVLGQAIAMAKKPPELFINAASATIYKHAETHPNDEYTTSFDNDFSVQVCKRWEATFFKQTTPATRKVALRIAITLGHGGVMQPYLNLCKFALGGKQGSGKQMFSWIHVQDLCNIISFIAAHNEMEGMYNAVAPNAVTNQQFMQALRKATGHKIGLPAYTWMLHIGAALLGTETELLLKSRWVLPTKLQEAGFIFQYPLLEKAFEDIIAHTPTKAYHLFK